VVAEGVLDRLGLEGCADEVVVVVEVGDVAVGALATDVVVVVDPPPLPQPPRAAAASSRAARALP
jgi:hypothetical protein